jgi:poly-gamma-glutamate capsule biosynthesis protein CapA/YwtB (metallophosphatase superfamily)
MSITNNTFLRKTAVVFILSAALLNIHGQDSTYVDRISLMFIGDIMGHDTQIASAYDSRTNTYNYDDVFKYIGPVISEPDVTVANLEVTLAGPPYKGYPQFSSPAALAAGCLNAGIDYFVLANNHSADRGRQGIISTINKLDSMGIPHTGMYLSKASRDTLSPLMIRKKGFSLALLNYTYGTNGIRVPKPLIVDSLDRNQVIADIRKARGMNPDAVILYLHWGTEYDTIPGRGQEEMAQAFIDQGADIVIGSHPHVLQKMIWKKDTVEKDELVVYSLGNFVSNQRNPKTDGGAMVRISLERVNGKTRIADAGYFLTWVHTPVINSRKKFYILPCSEFEKKRDFFSAEEDFAKMTRFISESRKLLGNQNEGIDEFVFEEGEGKWHIKKKEVSLKVESATPL